jgi:hypothetical protein
VVESRLAADPAALRIGMPMRLCPVALWHEPDGDVVGFAFTPDGADGYAA